MASTWRWLAGYQRRSYWRHGAHLLDVYICIVKSNALVIMRRYAIPPLTVTASPHRLFRTAAAHLDHLYLLARLFIPLLLLRAQRARQSSSYAHLLFVCSVANSILLTPRCASSAKQHQRGGISDDVA